MNLERRIDLIKKPPMEEIVTEEELKELLRTNSKPAAYDGFEPSGIAHLGSGIMRAIKIQDFLDAGIKFKLFIADWHAWINNKMGGDLKKIQQTGEYLVEVWKAAGVDTKKVEVLWASEFAKDREYWQTVIKIMKATTIDRMKRAGTIMGRKEGEMQYSAQLLYPAMQATDPFFLNVQICQLGIDQRKAYVLSREVGPKLGFWKPIIASHHLLIGLQGPTKMGGFEQNQSLDTEIASKMAKSIPKSYISVHDTPAEVKEKINEAFCPEKIVEGNPILEICKYIIFRKAKNMEFTRPSKYGGDVTVHSYEELEKMFAEGKLHPVDLKAAVTFSLNKILEPVHKHFEKNRKAKELFQAVKETKITR
jgi:tyrosyl-tRNA synthetase